MQMLAVIADILKIIGIILLCILAFLLIGILLAVFWPWRYCVDVGKEKKLTGKAVISWLFHILRIEVIYQESVNLRIRFLGIPIYDKLKREARGAAKREKAAAKEAEKKEREYKESEQHDADTGDAKRLPDMSAASFAQERHIKNKKTEKIPNPKKRNRKVWWEFPQYFFDMLMGWAEKLLDMIFSLPELVEEPVERLEKKISSVVGRIEYYTKLMQKKGSKWVVDFLKTRILKVLKHIRPRKSKIDLYYAADDPAKVADMMAYYGMALPFLPKHTNFTAELGEPRLEGTIRIKGRICLIVILWHGFNVFFNKKVRIFLKLLKDGQKIAP